MENAYFCATVWYGWHVNIIFKNTEQMQLSCLIFHIAMLPQYLF